MHVHLARVSLSLHVIVGRGRAHAVGHGAGFLIAGEHVGQADGVPHAHHGLAHHGLGARLSVEHRARAVLVLIGLLPEIEVRRSSAHGVGHLARVLGRRRAHGVVLHRPAVHRRHVGRAGKLHLAAVAPVALHRVLVVHAVRLQVVGAVAREALEVIVVVHLVIGARAARLLAGGLVLAHLLRRVVPRTRQHAVVPPLVLIVAEHVGGNVHLDLVAAQIAVENRLQGFGVLVVLAPGADEIGVGGVGGRHIDAATEPLGQILLHLDLQHPRLGAVAVADRLVRRTLGAHRRIGALRGVGGLGDARSRAARARQVRILHRTGRVITGRGARRRLHDLQLHKIGDIDPLAAREGILGVVATHARRGLQQVHLGLDAPGQTGEIVRVDAALGGVGPLLAGGVERRGRRRGAISRRFQRKARRCGIGAQAEGGRGRRFGE